MTAPDVEIERALHSIAATLNDQKLEQFEPDRVQEIVTEALGGEEKLRVDSGGGLHDDTGTRVGVIRRTPSGEWIVERQNETAERSDTAIPSASEQDDSRLKSALGKLKPG